MRPSAACAGGLLAVLAFPLPVAAQEIDPSRGVSKNTARPPHDLRARSTWTRVQISDPIAATLVRRALDEALQLVAESRCQGVVDEFRT